MAGDRHVSVPEAELTALRAQVERQEAHFDEMTRSCLAERAGRLAAEAKLAKAVEALTGMIVVGEAYLPYDAPNGPCAKRLAAAKAALKEIGHD